MTTTKKKMVLVRTYLAGVHFGELVSRKGQEAVIARCRRIWSWQGANSLNEIANSGVATGSKISEPTASVTLTQVIEVLDMAPAAIKRMAELGWGK
jgi:hypothetical protein